MVIKAGVLEINIGEELAPLWFQPWNIWVDALFGI